MGDRSNIVVKQGEERVYLYGHWAGFGGAVKAVMTGLARAPGRWTDAPYLTRILFDDFRGDNREATGFGIWPSLGDNEHPLVVVDLDTGCVYTTEEDGERSDPLKTSVPFAEFNHDVALAAVKQYEHR